MNYAYDRNYLNNAQKAMGAMFHYAVYDCGYELQDFYGAFLNSNLSKRFENGDLFVIAGMSGIEMAIRVLKINEDDIVMPSYYSSRSEEYWTGWVLAYYQWFSGKDFRRINMELPIEEIRAFYHPYHEMDITSVIERMENISLERRHETYLKHFRNLAGMSQSQLAEETGIPLKTIQQYEQGRKDIKKAQSEYVIRLAKALCCNPQDLL